MRYIFITIFALESLLLSGQPVFRNPGITARETFEINDFVDNTIGFAPATFDIELKELNGKKIYSIKVNEGNVYLTEIEVNYQDLTTIMERRTDLRSNRLEELYVNKGNGLIHFYSREHNIDKDFHNDNTNIYSRNSFFFCFRGFPFGIGNSVTFQSYMAEYGNALTLRLTHVAKETVTVKAGTFECDKMELSVAGWQSIFAPNKFYLYFAAKPPYQFIKYAEKGDDGQWKSNELSRTIK